MAQKIQVLNTCDIHGENEEATHIDVKLYDLDGRPVKLDLCEQQYARLAKALAPYLEKATRDSGARAASPAAARRTGSKHGASNGSRVETTKVRKWALEKGLEVSERGRIPKSIADQYRAEHADA